MAAAGASGGKGGGVQPARAVRLQAAERRAPGGRVGPRVGGRAALVAGGAGWGDGARFDGGDRLEGEALVKLSAAAAQVTACIGKYIEMGSRTY